MQTTSVSSTTYYYDVVLASDVPPGTTVLGRICTVEFTYPDGSKSTRYTGSVLDLCTRSIIRMQSSDGDIEPAWVGANGGELVVDTLPSVRAAITGFTKQIMLATSDDDGKGTAVH
ncbi:hypothetical protein [Pendulispora albinea]|uniref:Uncharacterized protein n=1 Tax=Pendulispora albinea TaxID=2741071 RepID=A0ABZ2MBG6_9BACT